ncbi:DDE-type integrase/transposase/recombinase [Paraburkholderia strydomiana]|jgi:putative transposase|uniref:DDE-type integrase/transposase/recombinase n=1 Tax=Paraburkholderia strydomiana TaxID=1245417 RepID=A0ABW9EPX2_9BURK
MLIVNRLRRDKGRSTLNRKPLHRPLSRNNLLQRRCLADKAPRHRHEGKVITQGPNLRWESERLELRCDNGEVVCVMFAIDTYSHQIIGWTASTAGFTWDSPRNFMLMCVKRQFGQHRTPHAVEWLSDNGHANTSNEIVAFAIGLGLLPRFAPFRRTASTGVAESFARTFLADYFYGYGRRDAVTVLGLLDSWFEDYEARQSKA